MRVALHTFDGYRAWAVLDSDGNVVTSRATGTPFTGYLDRFDLTDALLAAGYRVPASGRVLRLRAAR